jgi:hypothetical protein
VWSVLGFFKIYVVIGAFQTAKGSRGPRSAHRFAMPLLKPAKVRWCILESRDEAHACSSVMLVVRLACAAHHTRRCTSGSSMA